MPVRKTYGALFSINFGSAIKIIRMNWGETKVKSYEQLQLGKLQKLQEHGNQYKW